MQRHASVARAQCAANHSAPIIVFFDDVDIDEDNDDDADDNDDEQFGRKNQSDCRYVVYDHRHAADNDDDDADDADDDGR